MLRSNTSASNLHRRVRCPGSHFAEIGLPEQNSEYAEEGTRLHAALQCTPEQIRASLDPAQADLVLSVQEIFQEVIERTEAALAIPKDAPWQDGYEMALRIRKGIRTVLPGHCDYFRYYPEQKALVIQDAKFGFIEVTPAPLNLQLRAYAVMGSQEVDVETCVVAIAQPRAGMMDEGEKLTMARYDRDDLKMSLAQILRWEEEWLKQGAPRNPSEDACRYCKAKTLCPEYSERMTPLRGDVKAGIADLSEEQFFALFEALHIAKKKDIQETVAAEARIRAAEGRLPGYRLKPNAPRGNITDEIKAAAILRDGLEFSAEEIAEASSISLGSAVKVLRRKVQFKNEGAATEYVREVLAPVIELSTPEPSVVPVSKYDDEKNV